MKSLRSLVGRVFSASTIEDERALITKELAALRTKAKDCRDYHESRAIAKLVYLDM